MQHRELKKGSQTQRITSIDLLRGVVMIIMALDHVRMYFALGTWYSEPTNLSTTTPLLFFTRWITHFCAPVFVFLTGTSAFLYGSNKTKISELAWYLFTRGVWLIVAELTVINFAWTFDTTFSFRILQVIWAIGASLMLLSVLVFLPIKIIFAVGIILVFGHNLLDPITVNGTSVRDLLWYALHQPNAFFLGNTTISLFYPILPWLGLMALGYVFGTFYTQDFDEQRRRHWLILIGLGVVVLFLALRGFNLYGEPGAWSTQRSSLFTVISFLNTTKYPPSLHFLLMTMGPALIFLALSERMRPRITNPIVLFGRVPFFFYILHLYFIHAFAMLTLAFAGREWREYILTAMAIASGALSSFGLRIEAVYLVWILVIVLLYPFCRGYQRYKESNPTKWWLSYL
jgi:uncharacterized membrane protein